MKKVAFVFLILFISATISAQKTKKFDLKSPNGEMVASIEIGPKITWSVKQNNTVVLLPSSLSMRLDNSEILGKNAKIISSKHHLVNDSFVTPIYKKNQVDNVYNEQTIHFKGNYGLVIRAYNEGVAYRFFTTKKENFIVQSEEVTCNFNKDYTAFVPIVGDRRDGEKYITGFEEFYTEKPLSKLKKEALGFVPLMVSLDNNKRAVFLEADVQDYPELFVQSNPNNPNGFKGTFAPYPLEEKLGGFNNLNFMVTKRADYIAKVDGTRNFPWRVIVVSNQDKDLLNSDIVQKLSEPNKIQDLSWIKPGKVAWDWWNNWNLIHVDFEAGINTPTYKYYIDFATKNNLEYIVIDEGWSDDWDLNKLNPSIDLVELLAYAKEKNIGIILWSTWYALSTNPEGLFEKYAALGVKGFKVDFLDRNDQKMIASTYKLASIAAKNHMLLNYHGMFPPQGLNRTWPNVVNFESVRGMEWQKWTVENRVPQHQVSFPFLRMMAGPMDYTPGAMRNASKGNAKPDNANPMAMGTRCNQMAMFICYEAPLQMLADSPSAYMKEQECTDFIAKVPTIFDETVALEGKFGENLTIARRKGTTWYVGGMTNWDEKNSIIDFSFLGTGNFRVELFKDGINANKNATDYKKEIIEVNASKKLNIHLASGGGFAMIITKI